jgi:peptidoglycan/LPS O-acetylase OafA/YrhL
MSENNKIYLPGLNGIRAIAALAVVASHINHRSIGFGLARNAITRSSGLWRNHVFCFEWFSDYFFTVKRKKND